MIEKKCPVCGWENTTDKIYEHCPNCLSMIHEKDEEGEECGGIMEPVSVSVNEDGSWDIIERCNFCGEFVLSKHNEDDNPLKLMNIAMKPLANPPFPIDRIDDLEKMMGGEGNIGGYYE